MPRSSIRIGFFIVSSEQSHGLPDVAAPGSMRIRALNMYEPSGAARAERARIFLDSEARVVRGHESLPPDSALITSATCGAKGKRSQEIANTCAWENVAIMAAPGSPLH